MRVNAFQMVIITYLIVVIAVISSFIFMIPSGKTTLFKGWMRASSSFTFHPPPLLDIYTINNRR